MKLQDFMDKKLREAEYFLGKLNSIAICESGQSPDPEEFQFLLSAFLSASWSAIDPLDSRKYRKWYQAWLSARTTKDRRIISFIQNQRIAEVHREGAKVQHQIRFISITQVRANRHGNPEYGFHAFLPPGTPVPETGVTDVFFSLGGTKVEVVNTCRQFLSILRSLEYDFQRDHPKG